ncbi:MAG: UDP-glucose 4-epimerase GalE [Planctomycetia bacterium]|nr:UDP-glucose 4-epimerase GalE [Planctomycetia bacterium]
MTQILVTGGAGYIGSHAVKRLLADGHNVAVLDNLSRGHRSAVPQEARFYQTDLAETEAITHILRENAIEVVMHFAAFAAVGESMAQPLLYYQNNTAGAVSLLTAMQRCGVARLIFSSTAATFGIPDEMPIVETTRQEPVNPYGWSKWMVERALLDLVRANPQFGFTALRYFNVAGSAADGSIGEDHDPETHLIPNIIRAALGRSGAIQIFGTDYPTPDGTCIRDYVHVEDLIDAHVRSMNALRDGDKRFYNLGIGRGYSVREMIAATEEVLGVPIPVQEGPRRAGDPPVLFTSSEKIQRELGWKPAYTEAQSMIATAWNWLKNHPNGYGDS